MHDSSSLKKRKKKRKGEEATHRLSGAKKKASKKKKGGLGCNYNIRGVGVDFLRLRKKKKQKSSFLEAALEPPSFLWFFGSFPPSLPP